MIYHVYFFLYIEARVSRFELEITEILVPRLYHHNQIFSDINHVYLYIEKDTNYINCK